MGNRVSATGVTPYGFGATNPSDQTSQNAESAALIDVNKGVKVPAPSHSRPAQAGSKAKGATRTKGGSI